MYGTNNPIIEAERKEYHKKYHRKWYKKNLKKRRQQIKQHYEKNKEKIAKKYKDPINRLKINATKRLWWAKNKHLWVERRKQYRKKSYEKTLAYKKHKRQTDPNWIVARALRRRFHQVLKTSCPLKMHTHHEIFGGTVSQIKNHIEQLFEPWMSWQNYGHKTWHIDHIKPCSSFDLTDPAQQKICFNFHNLQPLAAKTNLQKSDKITA